MDELTRASRGRLLAGVCMGMARTFGIDVTLVRLAFLLLALAWGVGLVIYAALWLVLPPSGSERGPLRSVARQNFWSVRRELGMSAHAFRGQLAGSAPGDRRGFAVALLSVGVITFLASIGAFSWLTPVRALGLAAIFGGAAVLVGLRQSR